MDFAPGIFVIVAFFIFMAIMIMGIQMYNSAVEENQKHNNFCANVKNMILSSPTSSDSEKMQYYRECS